MTLTKCEALARSKAHRRRAEERISDAERAMASARKYARWAEEWSAWAKDSTGTVPYPLDER